MGLGFKPRPMQVTAPMRKDAPSTRSLHPSIGISHRKLSRVGLGRLGRFPPRSFATNALARERHVRCSRGSGSGQEDWEAKGGNGPARQSCDARQVVPMTVGFLVSFLGEGFPFGPGDGFLSFLEGGGLPLRSTAKEKRERPVSLFRGRRCGGCFPQHDCPFSVVFLFSAHSLLQLFPEADRRMFARSLGHNPPCLGTI